MRCAPSAIAAARVPASDLIAPSVEGAGSLAPASKMISLRLTRPACVANSCGVGAMARCAGLAVSAAGAPVLAICVCGLGFDGLAAACGWAGGGADASSEKGMAAVPGEEAEESSSLSAAAGVAAVFAASAGFGLAPLAGAGGVMAAAVAGVMVSPAASGDSASAGFGLAATRGLCGRGM